MTEKGAYIRDMQLLDKLNQEIKQTGEKMANIDSNVRDYLCRVKDALERQLDFLREKLEEAEARLTVRCIWMQSKDISDAGTKT